MGNLAGIFEKKFNPLGNYNSNVLEENVTFGWIEYFNSGYKVTSLIENI